MCILINYLTCIKTAKYCFQKRTLSILLFAFACNMKGTPEADVFVTAKVVILESLQLYVTARLHFFHSCEKKSLSQKLADNRLVDDAIYFAVKCRALTDD